ncbi:MAG: helix-turn-helix domain-containing protein [Bacteroidales bacterium]|nr:helix-turn-helix domain-containing protein [Bacteroidales bacterium]
MEQTFTLTPYELEEIIVKTIKKTFEQMSEEKNLKIGQMYSFNEARKILKIGYEKLYRWIDNGTLKTINGMIPHSEILKLQTK